MVEGRSVPEGAGRRHHFVQFYSSDLPLHLNVGRYLSEGLLKGDSGLVIASPEHREGFRSYLETQGLDPGSYERSGQLLFLDAEHTLSRFMVNGYPDWPRFRTTVAAAIQTLTVAEGRRLRAYGEMVGFLWASGEYSAAIKLEDYWNRMLSSIDASLFCAYPIDVFGSEFQADAIHAILCDHNELLPSPEADNLEAALIRATHAVAGERAAVAMSECSGCRPDWGVVPRPERLILWLRENVPHVAAEIFRVARLEAAVSVQGC